MVVMRYMDGHPLGDGELDKLVVRNQSVLELVGRVRRRVEDGQIMDADLETKPGGTAPGGML